MRTTKLWTLLAVLSLPAATAVAGAQTFDFESTTAGTLAPFVITQSGLTATFFSAGGDLSGVIPTTTLGVPFSTLSGNILANIGSDPFLILLNQTRNGVSLNFAIAPGTTISLLPFLGPTPLFGSLVTASGSVPLGGVYSEGVLSVSGATFDGLALVPTQQALFAIDNVAFTAAPEPSSVALLLGGNVLLFGAAAWRRRKTAV